MPRGRACKFFTENSLPEDRGAGDDPDLASCPQFAHISLSTRSKRSNALRKKEVGVHFPNRVAKTDVDLTSPAFIRKPLARHAKSLSESSFKGGRSNHETVVVVS